MSVGIVAYMSFNSCSRHRVLSLVFLTLFILSLVRRVCILDVRLLRLRCAASL